MTKWCLVFVLAGGCVAGEGARPHRWPNHRKQGDARFAELERATAELVRRNTELELRVKGLEEWVSHVKVKKPAEPPPDRPDPASAGSQSPPAPAP